MKSLSYNGVVIEVPVDRPVFSHSLPLKFMTEGKVEGDKNIPYFDKLMEYKMDDIPNGELLSDACRLYSIRNLNYQVNNGGFTQYYFNGYMSLSKDMRLAILAMRGLNAR